MHSHENLYLKRYAHSKQYLNIVAHENLGMIVVIPCYDEPHLLITLKSLYECKPPNNPVLVIIVINASQRDNDEVKVRNKKSFDEVNAWIDRHQNDRLKFSVILENNLPKKHAGVGLARKIGMDEAVRIFESINRDGIIVCFDADSQCDTNYLVEIEAHFKNHPKTQGCSIFFEHQLEGDLPVEVYPAIMNYELHLRYYINALKFSGFPHAHQTIGSSMAVRSRVYQKQGGMNKRKAGEDFYFLNKIIPLGNFTELNSTRVIPSSRKSHRVPFGTGKAVGDWVESERKKYETYAPQIFVDLKELLNITPQLFMVDAKEQSDLFAELPPSITKFLDDIDFISALNKIKSNSSNADGFIKQYYQWFDAFKILKFVHFARDNYYPNLSLVKACQWLCESMEIQTVNDANVKQMLLAIRNYDRAATRSRYHVLSGS